mmetsp:Transcript_17793/g.23058  ORF Transcript_17793/g.23058 Transcript_17793/m.23058 type:complete len:98 (-) Transcript_17793:727-1020(-)
MKVVFRTGSSEAELVGEVTGAMEEGGGTDEPDSKGAWKETVGRTEGVRAAFGPAQQLEAHSDEGGTLLRRFNSKKKNPSFFPSLRSDVQENQDEDCQ